MSDGVDDLVARAAASVVRQLVDLGMVEHAVVRHRDARRTSLPVRLIATTTMRFGSVESTLA